MIIILTFFMTPEEILRFARSLEREGDYFRAITEYKRYLYYNDVDSIRYRIVYIYLNENEYGNALFTLNEIKEKNEKYYNLKGWIFYKSGILDSVRNYWKDSKVGLLLIKEGRCGEGLSLLNINKKCPSYKNPYIGAIFSSLIPGAGRIYAGRIGDGIFSFFSVLSFAYSSHYYYRKGLYPVALILGGITGIFYFGEIFGAFISVKIYNDRLKSDFLNEIEDEIKW